MKKHVKYILFFIIIISSIVAIFFSLLTNQFFKFYNSYIEEEKDEIISNMQLAKQAVIPILKENDYIKLQNFFNTLKDRDIAIFILDEKYNLVASTHNIEKQHLKTVFYKNTTLKNYKHSIKTKMLVDESEINIKNKKYIIKVALLQQNMIETFLRNQDSIVIALFCGILIITILATYIIFYLKLPFDKLQTSVDKIANGNFDSDIYIINKGFLSEHSKTVKNMADQLKQKINDLKYLEICKNEMLSGLSHEVKTPLTSIMLASDLLGTCTKNEMNNYINIIQTNSERLNNLILNIIDIENLEYKALNDNKPDFVEFNINDIITSAINNSKILAKDIKINFNPSVNIKILADSQLIETAIFNIITNAIKYSNSKIIDIKTNIKDKHIIIKIRDYGIGIEKEHIDKIFNKFYTINKNKTKKFKGSGLGLAIVKNIIELHKGKIEVISNNGCEFIITLPQN